MRLDAHANASCLTYEVAVEIGRIPHCREAMGKSVRVFHRISLFSDWCRAISDKDVGIRPRTILDIVSKMILRGSVSKNLIAGCFVCA